MAAVVKRGDAKALLREPLGERCVVILPHPHGPADDHAGARRTLGFEHAQRHADAFIDPQGLLVHAESPCVTPFCAGLKIENIPLWRCAPSPFSRLAARAGKGDATSAAGRPLRGGSGSDRASGTGCAQ
jgi:hypothetical protein